MNRRNFITLLGGAATWPLAARAQQRPTPTIGLLSGLQPGAAVDAFLRGLKEAGFVEGQNVAIEYRFASGQYDRLPGLAAELMEKKVAVIATFGENAAKAAQAASGGVTSVVFALGDDPVSLGLVASLSRPGANITGSSSIGHTLGPKRVELLREFLPRAGTIALLTNPKQPREFERRDVESKVRAVGWELRYVTASSVDEFDQVFVKLGWIEGRNLTIEYRWAEGRSDRAGELAAELVGLKPDVIVTYANGSTGTCLRARAVLAHAARVPPGTGSA